MPPYKKNRAHSRLLLREKGDREAVYEVAAVHSLPGFPA